MYNVEDYAEYLPFYSPRQSKLYDTHDIDVIFFNPYNVKNMYNGIRYDESNKRYLIQAYHPSVCDVVVVRAPLCLCC